MNIANALIPTSHTREPSQGEILANSLVPGEDKNFSQSLAIGFGLCAGIGIGVMKFLAYRRIRNPIPQISTTLANYLLHHSRPLFALRQNPKQVAFSPNHFHPHPSGKLDLLQLGGGVAPTKRSRFKNLSVTSADQPGGGNPIGSSGIPKIEGFDPKRIASLENDVVSSLAILQRDQNHLMFHFDGSDMKIQFGQVTPTVNSALEKCGSQKRLFIAEDIEGYRFYWGRLKSEEIVQINGRPIRIIHMRKADYAHKVDENTIGMTDFFTTIVTFENPLNAHLRDRLNASLEEIKTLPSNYQSIRDIFFRTKGGIVDDNLQRFAALCVSASKAHIENVDRYGNEFYFLANDPPITGGTICRVISYLHAELKVIEELVALSKTNPEEAAIRYCILSLTSTARFAQQTGSIRSVAQLLLSAGEVKEGNLIIDWNRIETLSLSLKRLLEKQITQAIHTFKTMIATLLVGKPLQNEQAQKIVYDAFITKCLKTVQEGKSDISTEWGIRHSIGLFSQTQFDKLVPQTGKTAQQILKEAMDRNAVEINRWMVQKLSLSQELLPFDIAKIKF